MSPKVRRPLSGTLMAFEDEKSTMQVKRRIAVFVSFSGHGGVERMMINLCEGFLALGWPVDLLTVKAKSVYLQRLPEGLNVVGLGTAHTFESLPAVARYLRSTRPLALLAAKDRANQVAVLAGRLARTSTRIVLRMGTTVSAALNGKSALQKAVWYLPLRVLYPMADAVVAVSKGVATDMMQITRLPPHKIHVIPNPVVSPKMFLLAKEPINHPWFMDHSTPVIMGMGRLTRQKDFPTLIRAFATVRSQRSCRLVVFGEGRDGSKLKRLTEAFGIQNHVDFPGFVANPYRFLSRAALFVLSSIWEGSPNALSEAMALGVPVVSTDCPSGPREILDGGRYGALVPMGDADALAQAMAETLAHPPDKAFLQQGVSDHSTEVSSKRYLDILIGGRTTGPSSGKP
jgi:glycosyltransferase involved in cell wall biosynthesis